MIPMMPAQPLPQPPRGALRAQRDLLATDERLLELAGGAEGTLPAGRPVVVRPGSCDDLAALRDRLARGRDLLPRTAARPDEDLFPTAIPAVDALLCGGLPRGSLTELRGAPSSGRLSLVLALLAAATQRGEAAALVDLGDHLDPQAAAAAGVDLARLLWVRPPRLREALAAAEIALGGAFPLVVLELGAPPLRGHRDEHAWLRLARAARHHRGALLVATPYRTTGPAAAEVLALSRRRGVWLGTGDAPRLLAGVESRLLREKSRRRPQPAAAPLAWRAAGVVPDVGVPASWRQKPLAAMPGPTEATATAVPEVAPARPPAPTRAAAVGARRHTPADLAAAQAAAREAARAAVTPLPAAVRVAGRAPAPVLRPNGGSRKAGVAAGISSPQAGRPQPLPGSRPEARARVPRWVPLARAALAESLREPAPGRPAPIAPSPRARERSA
jgi:hypothetical protein